MGNKPPRRFWQIHLSTAVALMFVAGALVWKNVVSRHTAWYVPKIHSHQRHQQNFHEDLLRNKYSILGWPMVVSMQPVNSEDGYMDEPSRLITIPVNALAGILLLVVTAVSIEAFLNRREPRR